MSATIGSIIQDAHLKVTGYAKLLCDDIPAERFSERPTATMNHPTFCMGHLSIYPDRVLATLGRDDLVVERPGWNELFSHEVTCEDDTGQYPGKDEVVSHFQARSRVAGDLLTELDDDVFRQPLPDDHPMKARWGDVGSVVNFVLVAHPMVHLGQISTWRRAIGLGSVL